MYSFDNGDRALFTTIRAGYLALLEHLRFVPEDNPEPGQRGPYLQTLRSILSLPSAKAIDQEGAALIGPLPAALVEVTGGRVEEGTPDSLTWRLTVRVHIISGHSNRDVHGRLEVDESEGREPGEDPGIDVMLHHACEELHFQPPSENAEGIQIEGISHGMDHPSWSWWAIDTVVQVRQVINRHRTLPLLEGLDASHGLASNDNAIEHERSF